MRVLCILLITIVLFGKEINLDQKQLNQVNNIIKVCKKLGIKDINLYLAIAYTESNFNPDCRYKDAYGMFQNRLISVKAREKKLPYRVIKNKLKKDIYFSLVQCKNELEYWKQKRKSLTSILVGYNNGYNKSSKGYIYAQKVLKNKYLLSRYLNLRNKKV